MKTLHYDPFHSSKTQPFVILFRKSVEPRVNHWKFLKTLELKDKLEKGSIYSIKIYSSIVNMLQKTFTNMLQSNFFNE